MQRVVITKCCNHDKMSKVREKKENWGHSLQERSLKLHGRESRRAQSSLIMVGGPQKRTSGGGIA